MGTTLNLILLSLLQLLLANLEATIKLLLQNYLYYDADAVRGFIHVLVPLLLYWCSSFTVATSLPQFTTLDYTNQRITTSTSLHLVLIATTFLSELYKLTTTRLLQMSPYNVGDFEAGNIFIRST
jgi:hypothetical protein